MPKASWIAQLRLLLKTQGCETSRGLVELYWHADPRPLSSTIQAILAENPRAAENIAEFWLFVSLCQRDFDGAQSRSSCRCRSLDVTMKLFPFRESWCEGVVAQLRGDKAAARQRLHHRP